MSRRKDNKARKRPWRVSRSRISKGISHNLRSHHIRKAAHLYWKLESLWKAFHDLIWKSNQVKWNSVLFFEHEFLVSLGFLLQLLFSFSVLVYSQDFSFSCSYQDSPQCLFLRTLKYVSSYHHHSWVSLRLWLLSLFLYLGDEKREENFADWKYARLCQRTSTFWIILLA